MDWQPIETAPKGATVLLYFPRQVRGDREMNAEWVKVGMWPVHHPRQPTHWHPLPALPTVADADYDEM